MRKKSMHEVLTAPQARSASNLKHHVECKDLASLARYTEKSKKNTAWMSINPVNPTQTRLHFNKNTQVDPQRKID